MSISDDTLNSAVDRISELGELPADDRGRSIIKCALKEMLSRPVTYHDARWCRATIKGVLSIPNTKHEQMRLGQIFAALAELRHDSLDPGRSAELRLELSLQPAQRRL